MTVYGCEACEVHTYQQVEHLIEDSNSNYLLLNKCMQSVSNAPLSVYLVLGGH